MSCLPNLSPRIAVGIARMQRIHEKLGGLSENDMISLQIPPSAFTAQDDPYPESRSRNRTPGQCLASHDPLMSPRQKHMLWFLDNLGILGLHSYIMQIACEDDRRDVELRKALKETRAAPVVDIALNRQAADSNLSQSISSTIEDLPNGQVPDTKDLKGYVTWKLLIDDYKKGSWSVALYYLASMPLCLIRAIICGDLPIKMQGLEFQRELEPNVRLNNAQGVYAVYVAVARPHTAPGHGPTLRQMIRVTGVIRKYCDIHDPESAEIAAGIDCSFRDYKKYDYSYQRRYASGSNLDSFDPIMAWLCSLDNKILDWARSLIGTSMEPVLDLHMRRSLVYIGRSERVMARALMHSSHSGTSCILGLYTATLKYLYRYEFDTQSFTYQILHTASFDHIGLDEVLVAVLASGHHWDGGLNNGHTGTRPSPKRDKVSHEPMLAENHRFNIGSGISDSVVGDSLEKLQAYEHRLDSMAQRSASSTSSEASREGRELRKTLPMLRKESAARLKRIDTLLSGSSARRKRI